MASRSNPVIAPPDGLRITQLHRDHRGLWRARIHLDGEHVDVDRKFGSWQTSGPATRDGVMASRVIRREVRPAIAAALQGAIDTADRRVRRAS